MKLQNALVMLPVFVIAGCASRSAFPTPPGSPPGADRRLHDSVTVKAWAGGRRSALSLTFDDAMKDHVTYVRPLLARFGFKASFYVVPGFLDAGAWHNAVWNDFTVMADDGHEIGSHTVSHARLSGLPEGDETRTGSAAYELSFSKKEIERRFPGQRCLTMSYPYSDANPAVESLAGRYYLAARSEAFNQDAPAWNPAAAPRWTLLTSYVPRFPEKRTSPADDLPELEKTKRLLDLAVGRGEWSLLMIHSVVPHAMLSAYGGYETVSVEWLEALCAWMREKSVRSELWIDTVAHVTQYAREREAAAIADFSAKADEISFFLTDGMDDGVFDFPLTLEVQLPGDWRSAQVSVSGAREAGPAVAARAQRLIRIEAVPDRGKISLKRR